MLSYNQLVTGYSYSTARYILLSQVTWKRFEQRSFMDKPFSCDLLTRSFYVFIGFSGELHLLYWNFETTSRLIAIVAATWKDKNFRFLLRAFKLPFLACRFPGSNELLSNKNPSLEILCLFRCTDPKKICNFYFHCLPYTKISLLIWHNYHLFMRLYLLRQNLYL